MAKASDAPPPTLGEYGAAKWHELRPVLRESTPMVLATLEVYCAAYDRWVCAQRWLDEHGDVLEIVSDKGVVLKAQPAPKLDVAARAEKAMAEARRSLSCYLT